MNVCRHQRRKCTFQMITITKYGKPVFFVSLRKRGIKPGIVVVQAYPSHGGQSNAQGSTHW